MRVLLIGECYSENLGDPIICNTAKQLLQNNRDHLEIELFDISGKKNMQEYATVNNLVWWVKLYHHLNYRLHSIMMKSAFARIINTDEERHFRTIQLFEKTIKKKFDAIIFVGGQVFSDYFSGLIYYIVKRACTLNINISFHACGVGKCNNDTIKLLKIAFNSKNVKAISLRDGSDFFRSNFSTVSFMETFDTALACPLIYQPSKCSIAKHGVGIMKAEKYHDDIIRLLKYYKNANVSWQVFTNGAVYDQDYAENVLREVGLSEEEISERLIPRPTTVNQLINTITSFETITSFRMHSLIVATAFFVPAIGLVWDKKIETFYEKLHMNNYCQPEVWNGIRNSLAFSLNEKEIIIKAREETIADLLFQYDLLNGVENDS